MTTDGIDTTAWLMRLGRQQHGVVAAHQARAIGLSARQLEVLHERGVLVLAAPHTYRVAGAPRTWHQHLMLAVLAAGPDAVASHRSAAALHRLDGCAPGHLEITVPRRLRQRRPGVTMHTTLQLDPVDVTMAADIPVTTVARTLIDLAAVATAPAVQTALDGALRDGLVRLSRLRWRLEELRARGRGGVRTIERLLEEATIGRGPQSVAERELMNLVRAAGLPMLIPQVRVRRADGSSAYLDFVFEGTPVAVEVDGHGAHATRAQRRHDADRSNDLAIAGNLVVLRFTVEQIRHDGATVVATCRRALQRHAARHGAATA